MDDSKNLHLPPSTSLQKQQQAFKQHLAARLNEVASLKPIDTSGRHINSYVHQAIHILKQAERPISVAEFYKLSGLDLVQNQELLDKICRNERISFQNGMLAYNPAYKVKSKEDLLDLLSQHRTAGGLRIAELKDAFPAIDKAVNELSTTKQIIYIQPKDESTRILFINEYRQDRDVDPDIKSLWFSVRVPTTENMELELRKFGLKAVEVAQAKPLRPATAESKPSRLTASTRRMKFTNVHIEGFDPTQIASLGLKRPPNK